MSLSNYSELKTAVANWLNRPNQADLIAAIPDMILLSEAKLNRVLRVMDMEKTGTDTISSNEISLPSDFQEMKVAYIDSTSKYRLDNIPSFQRIALDQGDTGLPTAYSIEAKKMVFHPAADSGYTVGFIYYQTIPDLATNSTNWLLTSHPDIYLYSALLEAEPFLKNDARLAIWGGLLKETLDQLREASEEAEWSGAPLQMKVVN